MYENIVGIKYKYTGELKNNIPHGHGGATFYNGAKYLGEWKDGEKHGQGTLIYANGAKYVGEWKNGMAVSGRYYWDNGRRK